MTADPALVATFTDISQELQIEAEASSNCQKVSDQLNRDKYEGVVLDFDTVTDVRPLLTTVRESPANKSAIVFAVATNATHMEQAIQDRAHFLLRRPLDKRSIRQTLHAAYDLMERERRRYFRVSAILSVTLTAASNKIIQCSTINISGGGMAVATPEPFSPAETLEIGLVLPDGFIVCGTGIVIWDDKHGKTGLHFRCATPEMRQKLDSWLNSQFTPQAAGSRI